jgi:hypothetical protein
MSKRGRILVAAHTEQDDTMRVIAARRATRTNEGSMKQANRKLKDDIRPAYDFASMKGGVRGKYVNTYRAGTNLVLLDPEAARAFPTDAAVNQALRAVLNVTKVVKRPDKALQPKPRKARRG